MSSQLIPELNFTKCILCQQNSKETVQSVTEEALDYLFEAVSTKSDDISLKLKYYTENKDLFLSKCPVYHARCRRNYTRKAYKQKTESTVVASTGEKKRKTVERPKLCIICNKIRDTKGSRKLKQVTTFNMQNEIWAKAKEKNDEHLLYRIQGFGDSCIDMIANENTYHNLCILNYLKIKATPNKLVTLTFNDIFLKVLPSLEDLLLIQNKVLTVVDIRTMLQNEARLSSVEWYPTYPPSDKITNKLKQQFNDKVMVLPRSGKLSSYVCSTKTVVSGVDSLRNDQSSDSETLFDRARNSPYKLETEVYKFAKYLRAELMACQNEDSVNISKTCASNLIPKSIYNLFAWILTDEDVHFNDHTGKVILEQRMEEKILNICQDFLYCAGMKSPKHIGLAVYILKHTR